MRKSSILCVASLIFAATSVTAAPARAWIPECEFDPLPPTSTVSIENGEIRINPDGASDDLNAYRAWVNSYVNCWRNSDATDTVACIGRLGVGGPYVYQDPYTGEYVVAYQALIDHAGQVGTCLAVA